MKLKKDRRGMTLVELLVSLVILLLVISAAGTMLLSSNAFFYRSTDRSLDKISAEHIYKIASDKLTYATRIHLTDKRDESLERSGWHWIQISEDGRFYMDGKDIYGEDYYHGKTVSMEAYAHGKTRMYLQIAMEKNGKTYQSASSFEAINITAASQWETELTEDRKSIFATDSDGKAINEKNPIKSETGAYIYYDNEYQRVYTGTVADELYRRTVDNTVEYKAGKNDYADGNYVWYEGSWWLAYKKGDAGTISGPPGSNTAWKRVQADYVMPDWENRKNISQYEKGDVVSYDGKYYQSVISENIYEITSENIGVVWREVVKDETKSTATNTVWKNAN